MCLAGRPLSRHASWSRREESVRVESKGPVRHVRLGKTAVGWSWETFHRLVSRPSSAGRLPVFSLGSAAIEH